MSKISKYKIVASDTVKDRYNVKKQIYFESTYWETVLAGVPYDRAKKFVNDRLETEAWANAQKVEVYPPEEPIEPEAFGYAQFFNGLLAGVVGALFFAAMFVIIHG